jgi:hypothetical protein
MILQRILQNIQTVLQNIRALQNLPALQNIPLEGILVALGLGAIVLCLSLLHIFRKSVRHPKREQDRIRELLIATRSSLLELQSILASEVAPQVRGEEFGVSPTPAVARLGRGEVELLQKVSKYRMAAAGSQTGDSVKIH